MHDSGFRENVCPFEGPRGATSHPASFIVHPASLLSKTDSAERMPSPKQTPYDPNMWYFGTRLSKTVGIVSPNVVVEKAPEGRYGKGGAHAPENRPGKNGRAPEGRQAIPQGFQGL
jgi:hypothetical protein